MPIYEYQCRNCGWHFERRQAFSDEPLKTCEKCGGDLEKQWSLSGFQFKGAGWYVTDYAAKKGVETGKSDTTATTEKKESGGESTASTDSASKPTGDTSVASKPKGGTKNSKE